MHGSTAFVFVVHGGDLEIEAALLASSLRAVVEPDVPVLGAVPDGWAPVHARTASVLEELGVELRGVGNPTRAGHPHANPIGALRDLAHTAETLVLLDTDLLVLSDPRPLLRPGAAVQAKQADFATFGTDGRRWAKLFRRAGVAMPALRIPTTVSGDVIPPYLNPGFLAVRHDVPLGAEWARAAADVESMPPLPGMSRWSNIPPLAIALARLDVAVETLDERANHPTHARLLDPRRLPSVSHYHWPRVVRREPALVDLVARLVSDRPAICEVPAGAAWGDLLQLARESPRRPVLVDGRDVFLTGIPSGGIDEVRAGLAAASGTRIVDGAALPVPIGDRREPHALALLLRDERSSIDTTDGGADVVVVDDGRHLARLLELRPYVRDATVLACVRDPFETIAAWKAPGAPRWLTDADVGAAPDGWFAGGHDVELAAIAGARDAAVRRALLWSFLARRVCVAAPDVHVVRHEHRRDDLAACLPGREVTVPSAPSHRELLTDRERSVIRAVCTQAAADLGLACDGSGGT